MEEVDSMEGVVVSIVDSTQRLKWEVSKERFDSEPCFKSPDFKVHMANEQSTWVMGLLPKSKKKNKEIVKFVLELKPGDFNYLVQFGVEMTTPNRYPYPGDRVKDLYSNNKGKMKTFRLMDGKGTQDERLVCFRLGSTERFRELFSTNEGKVTVVVTLVIYGEGKDYIHHRDMAINFKTNYRSMSELDMFSDFTVICGNKQFKCHRNILASMSTIFKTMLTNEMFVEMKENSVIIEDSDMVEAMLYYMANNDIPEDIDVIAVELIHLADKYDLQDLIKACEISLISNISVDNVIETLIVVDLYVPKSENRKELINFIKNKAREVMKSKDWIKFVQNYPNLVTEVIHAMANALEKAEATPGQAP